MGRPCPSAAQDESAYDEDIVKNNPSVKRLKLSGDEEALEEIWQEVTKMLRMDPAKEGIFIPYNP